MSSHYTSHQASHQADTVRLFSLVRISLSSVVLAALLVGDLVFIGLHVLDTWHRWENPALSLEADQSLSELFQYLKWATIAVLLAAIALKKQASAHLVWVAVFLYFLLDDALSIHEQVSKAIREPLGLPHPLVELLFSLAVGGLMLALLAIAWVRGSQAFRKFSLDIATLIVALAFFGVGIDLVHPYAWHWGLGFEVGLIEDGGEMVVASLIVAYVLMKAIHFILPQSYLRPEQRFLCEPLYGKWLKLWTRQQRNRQ